MGEQFMDQMTGALHRTKTSYNMASGVLVSCCDYSHLADLHVVHQTIPVTIASCKYYVFLILFQLNAVNLVAI